MARMSTRQSVAIAVVSALVALSPHARGEDAAASSLSPPPLTLTVTPGASGGPWKLRIENTGDLPVRIAADPRLLVLEVTPPAGVETTKKKAGDTQAVRCALPDDARPSTDEGRELVVPAKRSWTQIIDPLFYCFGARERAALVVGATVKAHFGWLAPPAKAATRAPAKPAPLKPPFVAEPVGAAVGHVAAAKAIEAASFTLAEAAGTPLPAAASTALSISLPEAQDAARGNELSTTVTLANDGDKPIVLLFRPETLRFGVAGPAGSVSCGTTRVIGSPIRELYSTVGVKARASVTLLLTAVCPSDTFDQPGIYRVTPMLDTSGASARSIGLKTWDGALDGRSPMLLRVRSPRRASMTTATRPVLD